jgi:flavin reductase (DIM6/NTAB) family NADH-FMN oxidoreductase RutF
MGLDATTLRMTMRQWVTGVTVVTSVFGDERFGMTVSSFTSVSLDPPTVLVCLHRETRTNALVQQSGVFAVSLLKQGQDSISNRFAGFDPTITDRFEGVVTHTAETGSPLIDGALGWLDCVVKSKFETGTHTIFIAEVVYAHVQPESEPLVYYNRAYQTLVPVQQTAP